MLLVVCRKMVKKQCGCDGLNAFNSTTSRREFMYVGLVEGLGLTLPDFLKIKAQAAQKDYMTKEGKAKSIIHIYLPGGMAYQESFDPKRYAPLEYRGPLLALQLIQKL